MIIQTLAYDLPRIDLVINSGVYARYALTDFDTSKQYPSHVFYRVVLHDGARFELSVALIHAAKCTIDVELIVQGRGARADIVLLYGLSDRQHITIKTVQKHTGHSTTSSVIARGIVTDHSIVEYHGMISLREGSTQAKAQQEHTTIVVSKHARVVSIPSIEVLHHDVQCFHGAAIGQFDQQQLWYLQSRGFQEKEAYRMLLHSFFAEYAGRFPESLKALENLCQKLL